MVNNGGIRLYVEMEAIRDALAIRWFNLVDVGTPVKICISGDHGRKRDSSACLTLSGLSTGRVS
jgi:hypothetical protein